jgi:integrase/recombinase XerD
MNDLTVKDIAKDLGLNIRTIQKYIKGGFLPARTGFYSRVYLISPKDYQNWKEKHFKGITRNQINKRNSIDRGPTKAELLDLRDKWLESLDNGSFNGKIYSKATIETYEYHISPYLKCLGSNPTKPLISSDKLEAVFLEIGKEKYATRRKVYDTLICFTNYLASKRSIEENIQENIRKIKPKRFKPVVKTTINEKQTNALLESLDSNNGSSNYDRALTRALIICMQNTGLRASEVCNLKLKDVNLEERCVYVWLGKGNQDRQVGINKACYEALLEFIEVKTRFREVHESKYFFVGKKGNKLNKNSLRQRWNRLSEQLDFKITSHAFRRSFVTLNASKSVPLDYIRIAVGHSNLSTTQGYLMATENEVLEAMKN